MQNKGGRNGDWSKKWCAPCLQGSGLEPGIYRVLGESPQLHTTEVVLDNSVVVKAMTAEAKANAIVFESRDTASKAEVKPRTCLRGLGKGQY